MVLSTRGVACCTGLVGVAVVNATGLPIQDAWLWKMKAAVVLQVTQPKVHQLTENALSSLANNECN